MTRHLSSRKTRLAQMLAVLGMFGVTAVCAQAQTSAPAAAIYLDPSKPSEQRIQDLIGRMTLAEKAKQLFWGGSANERLGIPAYGGWNQSLHGVWAKQPTTLFPTPIGLAATWNPELIKQDADAISDEARALYNIHAAAPNGPAGLIYRAPVINISRDPLWGRIQECYGEDPYLTGRMGVAYVQGLQGSNLNYLKVAATLKHFAVNNEETGRLGLEAIVPERMLYEYFLPHWKECVVEGHAQSLMAAYNGINGFPCAINHMLLTDILRGQWGFDGFVVSDLGGVKHLVDGHHLTTDFAVAAALAIKAGTDYDDQEYQNYLPEAVQRGLITEADVNQALTRHFRVAFRLGVFDPPASNPYAGLGAEVINSAAHRAMALKTAQQSLVLLTNKDNFLPLDKSKVKTIAVIGPVGDTFPPGSYFGTMPEVVGPLAGIKAALGTSAQVTYVAGCDVVANPKVPLEIDAAVQAAKASDIVVLCVGTDKRVEAESRDRKALGLPDVQEQLLEAVVTANPRTVVVLMNGGPLEVDWAAAHAPAILDAFYGGEEAGTAIANALFGDYNPGGHLPYTVYASMDGVPPFTEYDITKGFTYMYFPGKPLFPFGHGLSYTQFAYSNIKLSAKRIPGDGQTSVSLNVKNTGKRAGDEVVQLYIHSGEISLPMPIKKLAGFHRIHLEPGKSQSVTFPLTARQAAFYDVTLHKFRVNAGHIDVMVGSSSGDIRVRDTVVVSAPAEFAP